ncbi:MAG: papain-like cysteine protease family protein [Calditrichota bacterium]
MTPIIRRSVYLALLFCCFTLPATAQEPDSTKRGDNYYHSGKQSSEFSFFAATRQRNQQRQTNSCWAACIQMLLNSHGMFVTQRELMRDLFGNLPDIPAFHEDILTALSESRAIKRGAKKLEYEVFEVAYPEELTSVVQKRGPMIVEIDSPGDSLRHIVVLSEIFYSNTLYENPVIDKVVLRDPWPTGSPRLELSWIQFKTRKPLVFSIWFKEKS